MVAWKWMSLLMGILITQNFDSFFVSGSSDVVDLTGENFKTEVLDSDKPGFVEFYAPWCFHCRRLVPIWEKFATEMKDRLVVGKVDCTQHESLRYKYRIESYPTIKLFMRGKMKDYHGARTADGFMEYLSHSALRNATVYDTNNVSLHYLDYRGEAEVIRLSLEAMSIPYQDVRYKDAKEFLAVLPSMITDLSKFPPMDDSHISPIITMGEISLIGMTPILRHIGREFGLYGEDDGVVTDEINEVIENLNEFRKMYLDIASGDYAARRTSKNLLWVELSNMNNTDLNGVYSNINPAFHRQVRNKGIRVLYEHKEKNWLWFKDETNRWLIGNIPSEIGTTKCLAFLDIDPDNIDYEEHKKYPWKAPQEWKEFDEESWITTSAIAKEQKEVTVADLEMIIPISVEAISSFSKDQDPMNLVNGNGLTDDNLSHDNDKDGSSMWHTRDAIDPSTGWLIFSFATVQKIVSGAVIWNLNQPSKAHTAGITSFTILYSKDENAKNWEILGDFDLVPCTGESSCAGQRLHFDTEIENVWSIKFEVKEVASGLSSEFIGLSEVRFVGEISNKRRAWAESKNVYKKQMQKWLSYMNSLLEKNYRKGGFLAGSSQPSIADFYGFDLVSLHIEMFDGTILSKKEHLLQWYGTSLGASEVLVDYITSDRRPQHANPNHYIAM